MGEHAETQVVTRDPSTSFGMFEQLGRTRDLEQEKDRNEPD